MFWALVTFLAAAAGTLALGLVLRWVDRKVTAMVQWRVGPPFWQPALDIIKLMGKETLMPASARGGGFLLAPLVALSASGVAAALVWRGLLTPSSTFVGDVIVVLYLLVIPPLMTIVGASASGNPHAAVGASREMKLLLSYELPMFLAIMVAVVHVAGGQGGWTFQLGSIVQAQASRPVLYSISGAAALAVSILAMQAKLGQVPFDLAEAECEIMSGVYVEYSGPPLACWLMARAMMLATLPLLLILLFWGGLRLDAWWGYLTFAGKYVLLAVLVTLIRNTNPRLRIDQTIRFFWFGLTPAAIAALVLALAGYSRGVSWL